MNSRAIPVLLVVGMILTGCGLHDPYSQESQKGPATAIGSNVKDHPSSQGLLAPASNATGVVVRYATVWVNWSATTLARQRAELLSLASGTLADELRREAAQDTKARLQEVNQSYSRGRYVGAIAAHSGRLVVVTYEEVAPLGGQAQGAYHVYLVRTEHTTQGWKLSEWQPATDN